MAEQDAETIRGAMKGMGTDEETIIKIVCNRTNEQRLKIAEAYKTSYGRDLIEDLKSELKGNLEHGVVALFYPPIDFSCMQLKQAMKGAGTDEDTIIEIIASKKNDELSEIKKRYKELYEKDLEEAVKGEVNGDLERLLVSLIQCNRSTNLSADQDDCKKQAQDLFEAGEGSWGTDESVFNKIFVRSSPSELLSIAIQYEKVAGKSIIQALDKEFSGDMLKAYQTILYAMISPSEYFARRVNKAIKGFGTDDSLLIRILVVRDEIDLKKIKQYYKKIFETEMIDDIKSDCTGDYEKFLVELASH